MTQHIEAGTVVHEADLADNARYTLTDGLGGRAVRVVDQRRAPQDLVLGRVGWKEIGALAVKGDQLNVMLGDYPNTVALTQGKVKSDRLRLNFAEAKVPHDNFKRVVKGEFDVAELAIMTFLQAIGWGRPLTALPVVVHGRFQHGQIAYNADRGTLAPADLHGKRVGVRTYPQTTPTWVRGILQNDYGVDLSKIQFITFDDGHVPEYRDPPNCQRSKTGKKLLQMLLDGDVDAAVLSGDDLKHPKLKPLIPDPATPIR